MQHAPAYLLTLIGSILFADHSGNSISAIYLPLLKDFKKSGRYSWASGLLSFLYRELCLATKQTRKQIGGALILLQLWSWERFPMGRPIRQQITRPVPSGEDANKRPPFAYKWSGYHHFDYNDKVLKEYHITIDRLDDQMVKWQPYEGKLDFLPPVCKPVVNYAELKLH